MRRRKKSGGREPAVGLVTQLQLRTLSSSDRRQLAAGRKPRLQRQRAGFPRFEFAYREHPTGADAPRSYVAVRTFAGEKTIFSMHERTFTRAAGVSPPWYRKTHLQRRVIFAEWLRLPLHNRLPHHGGLTPPALAAKRTFAGEKNDFCGAGTHIHKSGERQPTVVCDTYDVREEWSAVRVRPNRHQERRASARRGRHGRREGSREPQEANCLPSYKK